MAQGLERAADVPAHLDRNKPPDDFVALNKSLRACFVCRLIKSERQVGEAKRGRCAPCAESAVMGPARCARRCCPVHARLHS